MEAYWKAMGTAGLEHLILQTTDEGCVADGLVLRCHHGTGLRLWYELRCDANWHPRELHLQLMGADRAGTAELRVAADGNGRWFDSDGRTLDHLTGCIDTDIMATPFTNTLAIRHLALDPGQSAELDVVYVAIPQLQLKRARQRYTCLSRDADNPRYLYESLESGFRAELTMDARDLVVAYQGVWQRVGPGAAWCGAACL